VVQADGGYGDITALRVGLQERGRAYVVQVKATTSAQLAHAVPVTSAYGGRGRPRAARYPPPCEQPARADPRRGPSSTTTAS
jgi:hypothetical protein